MEIAVTEETLATEANALATEARAIKIIDADTYLVAGEKGKGLKDLRAKIVDYFAPLKDAAHKAHKAITTKESGELKPVDEAINILRDSMNAYNREKERVRLAEERRLQDIENERVRKEQEKLLSQAAKAEEKGNTHKAEELLERAELAYAAPVTVAPAIPKTVATSAGNVTQAKEINVTVMDAKVFVKALLEQYPNSLAGMVEIKAGPLKAWAKANGLDRFPGLNIVKTTGVRF